MFKPAARISARLAACLLAACLCAGAEDAVRLWEEALVIPTYGVAPPDPYPRFYQGRVYQGAKASYYPYAASDTLTGVKKDKTYRALCLENKYVKLQVLPELGGRIFTALDKTNGYDFFYRQRVIKPALIGMLGAWISGGAEWNVPHHHRASSFMAVDWTVAEDADGGKTIWVGETELRHRMRWIVGVTLRPDSSELELEVKIFNRTPVANAFLFWINPGVHATPEYQVIFPPDTEWAVQHGKPEFASWPIARQVYGGVDYTAGVDISWWRNHPAPVSFFAWNSQEDFFGGYDHGKDAGVLHVADHHAVPGKKFFEWGDGPEGDSWTAILTDEDGPYLELMVGAYSDNQPDYSWIQPGEVKEFKHWWYPVRSLGAAKNANREAAVNLEARGDGAAVVAFNTTREHIGAVARLAAGDRLLLEREITIGPARPFRAEAALPAGVAFGDLRAALAAPDGRELIAYRPAKPAGTPMPAPARKPAPPREIATNEELYLTGLRLEQLHSPAMDPAAYYEEALRRDPGDYRANTALGVLLLKAARYEEAETCLRAAVARATQNHIRPKDGEAFYYLGIVLKARGLLDAAWDELQRAVWSAAWQAPGYHALAEIACLRGNFAEALALVERSLGRNSANTRALALRSAVLRRLDRPVEAYQNALAAAAVDPLDFRAVNELCLALAAVDETALAAEDVERLGAWMRGEAQSYLELAVDYGGAGFYEEACGVLERAAAAAGEGGVHPMVYYFLGWYSAKQGRAAEAADCYRRAARLPSGGCFPLRFEALDALADAMRVNPTDARAPYYLGNLLYDHQPRRAIEAWERAAALDPAFAPVHRNLANGYAWGVKDPARAIASFEKAIALDPGNPRWYFELDGILEAAGAAVEKRLALLRAHAETVARRDDAMTRMLALLIRNGAEDEALAVLATRRFHNWEGSDEIHGVYVDACLTRGHRLFRAKDYAGARAAYEAALLYPENLEVGRPYRDYRAGEKHYFIGLAREALGDGAAARACFEKAAAHALEGASEARYHQACALRKLGRDEEAGRIFAGLAAHGAKEIAGAGAVDYFAKFGERRSERARIAQAHYLLGLGYRGQGREDEAVKEFRAALELAPDLLGARTQLAP